MSLFILNKNVNRAVKAIIYRSDGKLLMQQRDSFEDLPFPSHWNFFGGLVDKEESMLDGLSRELLEELNCIPGRIQEKLFEWDWDGVWWVTNNHFFPIFCESIPTELVLKEGSGMKWVSVEELIDLPLTPAVYENFSKILKFFLILEMVVPEKIELELMRVNNFEKKNDRVFYMKKNPCSISRQQMFILKELAVVKDLAVLRVCLHTDDEADIHEMIMIHSKPSKVGPHKQLKTSLSYHIIEGELLVELFDDKGSQINDFLISNNKQKETGAISLRLDAKQYRAVSSRSPFAIFLEVASGPFQDSDTIWLKDFNHE